MQAPADEMLIGRIARGDRLAMQVLFARHHVRIYRFVLRLLREEMAAEDVISEVFLDVWRQASRFEGRSAVSTWLIAIARFKALSMLRKRREEGLDEETMEAIEEPSDNPAISIEKLDKGEKLRQCLGALTREHREVIDLVYYHEKSVEEVAQIIGIPENTVKTRMFYARKKLGELCRRRELIEVGHDKRGLRMSMEPTEIETLLPWYAAGTLRRRDRQRVEDALRYDPALAHHADLVREELAETISFNKSLGVPSARCMDRLMAAIDAETMAARKRNSARAVAAQFSAFIAGFSPRTLAVAASFAVAAIALQAFFLVSMATKPQSRSKPRASTPRRPATAPSPWCVSPARPAPARSPAFSRSTRPPWSMGQSPAGSIGCGSP